MTCIRRLMCLQIRKGMLTYTRYICLQKNTFYELRNILLSLTIWQLSIVCTIRNIDRSQVETVGDKYMAVSGLPEYEVGHAKHISLLALDMMDLSQTVTVDGEPVVSIL